ncbi:dnaJ homolog subfamily C member 24 isoform X1 [Narcine bancroftii]|uniref:dnaJ homolog subfamily C member 24 isoform X1 n=1 Tax=Narcine bancroftii TaxID=1343680 RepID=UPI0038313A56
MSSNTLQKDWYEILGAGLSDSQQELRHKYQRLILLYHPDKQSADVPAGELEERAQRFIEIDQAWKILGNEETKREYDLQRREVAMTQKWPVDAQVPLEDMNWIEASSTLGQISCCTMQQCILSGYFGRCCGIQMTLEDFLRFRGSRRTGDFFLLLPRCGWTMTVHLS